MTHFKLWTLTSLEVKVLLGLDNSRSEIAVKFKVIFLDPYYLSFFDYSIIKPGLKY